MKKTAFIAILSLAISNAIKCEEPINTPINEAVEEHTSAMDYNQEECLKNLQEVLSPDNLESTKENLREVFKQMLPESTDKEIEDTINECVKGVQELMENPEFFAEEWNQINSLPSIEEVTESEEDIVEEAQETTQVVENENNECQCEKEADIEEENDSNIADSETEITTEDDQIAEA